MSIEAPKDHPIYKLSEELEKKGLSFKGERNVLQKYRICNSGEVLAFSHVLDVQEKKARQVLVSNDRVPVRPFHDFDTATNTLRLVGTTETVTITETEARNKFMTWENMEDEFDNPEMNTLFDRWLTEEVDDVVLIYWILKTKDDIRSGITEDPVQALEIIDLYEQRLGDREESVERRIKKIVSIYALKGLENLGFVKDALDHVSSCSEES